MKMSKLTPEQAQALTNLRKSEDFAVFMNYVGQYGEDIIQALLQNPKLDNPEYHRGTGGGITEIISAVEKAPSVFEQYKTQQK